MIKIWIYIFTIVSVFMLALTIMSHSSLILFFIYSELFWMSVFILTLFFAMASNDPVYIVMGFLVFLLAAIELVLISIILASRLK